MKSHLQNGSSKFSSESPLGFTLIILYKVVRAHDKEGTRADVSAPDWSANDWSAPEGTKMLPADQSEADTSAPVSPYHGSVQISDTEDVVLAPP
ncbi:hypothetical protein Tco_0854453 [Tanacetum coccineum]